MRQEEHSDHLRDAIPSKKVPRDRASQPRQLPEQHCSRSQAWAPLQHHFVASTHTSSFTARSAISDKTLHYMVKKYKKLTARPKPPKYQTTRQTFLWNAWFFPKNHQPPQHRVFAGWEVCSYARTSLWPHRLLRQSPKQVERVTLLGCLGCSWVLLLWPGSRSCRRTAP